MSLPHNFKVDTKRDATDSIRGYVYQAYQSILAWVRLNENDVLVLEGAEDFDIHDGSSVTTTQVKDVSSKLTLRSQAVVDSLNNYWTCRESNPGHNVVFRFLSTAEAGQEKGSPFGADQKGLEYWQQAELDHTDIKLLREFLLKLKLSSSLASFIKDATDDDIRVKLIRRVKWDLGNKPREAIKYAIRDKLKNHGFRFGINSHYSCQALPHLLEFVADLLSEKGLKELRFSDFITCFDGSTTLTIPRGQMEAMASGANLKQFSGELDQAEISRLSDISPIIKNLMPIVDGGIARSTIVSNFTDLLHDQRVIFLYGSSGSGKTNLASLISYEIGGSWGWIGFRGMEPAQIKHVLARATFEMNESQLTPFIILDDVDLGKTSQFETELVSLVFSIINENGMVIVTGPIRPPLQLLPKLWKNDGCGVAVPYFDEAEVKEMVVAHGLLDDEQASTWAKTIWVTTSGHPQLVHARVRNLSSRDWPPVELSDLTKPDDVERVRSEVRSRLVEELPNDNARVLAYRLSIVNGAFSRETAIKVAEISLPINLPGEVFDVLIGPWVEREEDNRYRISPLLKGAANSVLSVQEINAAHGAVAVSIMERKVLNQLDVGTALFHAFMAKHTDILMQLAFKISTFDIDNIRILYDVMSWFTMVCLDEGQKILPENQNADFMLRLAQYKLISCAPKTDTAIRIIERIEELLNEIEHPEFKQNAEALAYSMVLSTIDVHIPSSMTVRMLSRLIDLIEENPSLNVIADSFEKGKTDLPVIGENKPAQVLFSFLATRMSGLEDLLELVTSLDYLSADKRKQLLLICSSDIGFASLLVNRAWWKEFQDGEIDVNKALEVLNITAMKSREWEVPELTIACLVAMSVMHDEYGESPDCAHEILDKAEKEFSDEASLVNQRVKVLFHEKRYSEVMPLANKALELPSLSNVDSVFCCRYAGIAAAELGDWVEAERLFLLGAKKAECSDFKSSMETGFMADAAFALWKQNEYERSILLFADTLEALEKVTISEDILIRHLHATVRHSISWVHGDALHDYSVDLVEPLPGMCSNQVPNEGIKNHRLIDLSAAWALLVIAEETLNLDVGIRARELVATGGKKPAFVETYSRLRTIEAAFKNKEFENFIPLISGVVEALNYSKMLENIEDDGWTVGDVPKLPDKYWEGTGNIDIVYHFLLSASVTIIADNQVTDLPVEQWHSDLSDAGALSNELDQFLSVLTGADIDADDSLYQQAGGSIFKLSEGVLDPKTLWKVSFHLLNALMNDDRWVGIALEKLIIERWLFAISKQRFSFFVPDIACQEIGQCCVDKKLNGIAKVAAVLYVAEPFIDISVSPSVKEMLKKLIGKVSSKK